MAEDKSSKTEPATPKKLRDAKKKGQVPKSKDVVSTTILILIFTYFYFFWNHIQENLETLILLPQKVILLDFAKANSVLLDGIVQTTLLNILLPIALISLIGGIMGNILQFGLVFSWDPVKAKFEKISPASGFKKIFSIKQLKTTAVSALKIIAISVVFYFVLHEFMYEAVFDLNQCNIQCEQTLLGYFIRNMVVAILLIIILTTIIDYLVQRSAFLKDQMMSKYERKSEQKNTDGNPEIKSKRKQLQREINADDIKQKIKDSRILIYSAGITVVLHYEQGVTPLPLIASIGKAKMAGKMLEIARSEKVPIFESDTLAESLLENGTVDQYIPEETIEGVANAIRSSM